MSEITSPPVRYTGSKWRIAPWVISHFPKHVCYVEPFCGGAAILFRKPPSYSEVINDINKEVINFFDVLRDRTEELLRAIDLTPWSRFELERAMIDSDDPIERARRLYIRARQAFTAGEAEQSRGWRYQKNASRGSLTFTQEWAHIEHLRPAANRLKMAHIECDTALKIIERYDQTTTLFYVDPPYVQDVRVTIDYADEMSNQDHVNLSSVLHNVEGMVVLSGYDCELYQDLYSTWGKRFIKSRTINLTERRECLWINEAAQRNAAQKTLF